MSKSLSPSYVGQRLSIGGDLCTVRYNGPISGLDGSWLGVEWDKPTRGKHSGEHNGVEYFECRRKHPTIASFVRPQRPTDCPQSFLQALREKYAPDSLHSEEPPWSINYTGPHTKNRHWRQHPIRISGKEVEEVGFEKIRRQLADLHELRIAIVDGMCIQQSLSRSRRLAGDSSAEGGVERPTDVREVCPKIVELDLSRNLFEDWREILYICEQLDEIKDLRVNGNRFQDINLTENEHQYLKTQFERIKALSVDETFVTRQELSSVLTLFHKLTFLSASTNALASLNHVTFPHSLTTIVLEDDEFTALEDVAVLAVLPNLKRLTLKNNLLSRIRSTSKTADVRFAPSLGDIDLSYNAIDSWAFIDELPAVFPGMTSLRIAHNPLYQSLVSADGVALSADDGYFLTIARLGELETLNFSKISNKERSDAEVYYLSQIAKELSAHSADDEASIIARHPRYDALCAKYGEITIKRASDSINPNSLAARLITISFKLGDSVLSEIPTGTECRAKSAVMEIPKGMSMYAVLGIIGEHFGVRPMSLKLVWETGEWDYLPPDPLSEDVEWDSEEDEDGILGQKRVPREIVLRGSTKLIGTQVDGMEAVIRVEFRDLPGTMSR